jgi:lauroyl/myristoyl acyltransferase
MTEKIVIYFLNVFSRLLRLWPGDFQYIIQIKAFVIGKILRYRKKTVVQNLERISGQLPSYSIQNITNEYYLNITKYILEILISIRFSPDQMLQKVKILDQEKWNKNKPEGSAIITASHYGDKYCRITLTYYK